MCGRVIQSSAPVRYAILDGMDVRDSGVTLVGRERTSGRKPAVIGFLDKAVGLDEVQSADVDPIK